MQLLALKMAAAIIILLGVNYYIGMPFKLEQNSPANLAFIFGGGALAGLAAHMVDHLSRPMEVDENKRHSAKNFFDRVYVRSDERPYDRSDDDHDEDDDIDIDLELFLYRLDRQAGHNRWRDKPLGEKSLLNDIMRRYGLSDDEDHDKKPSFKHRRPRFGFYDRPPSSHEDNDDTPPDPPDPDDDEDNGAPTPQ